MNNVEFLHQVFDMGNYSTARRRKVSFPVIDDSSSLEAPGKDESGYSLVEVVIAMAIISIAVVGLVGGLSLVIRISDRLEEQAVTETLAAGHVEEHLNGVCPAEDSFVDTYSVEGRTADGMYVVEVSSEDEPLFSLSTLAAVECAETPNP